MSEEQDRNLKFIDQITIVSYLDLVEQARGRYANRIEIVLPRPVEADVENIRALARVLGKELYKGHIVEAFFDWEMSGPTEGENDVWD